MPLSPFMRQAAADFGVIVQERIVLGMLMEGVRSETDALPDGMPDWYCVSPFRSVTHGLRRLIRDSADILTAAAPGLRREAIDAWTAEHGGRVGTVHVAQGREAPVIVMCLGGNPAHEAAIRWVGREPNLLNVCAFRAKRSLHFVGDRGLWARYGGVFGELASDRPLGQTFPSLAVPPGSVVDFSRNPWLVVPS